MNTHNWKTSILRWLAWLILCAGMIFEIFVLLNTGMAVISQLWGQPATNQPQAGRSIDVTQVSNYANFVNILLYFIVGILIVALVVFLDYYLRVGERKGRLHQRIGLALGLEAGIFLAVQFFFAQLNAIQYELRALYFPYPLDYGEGQVLDQVNHLAHFLPIYFTSRATHIPPYTIANYPPLYQLIQVPFVWLFGSAFWYGRLISLLGVLAGAVSITLIIHTLTGNWAAGVIGGMTTLCMPQIIGWAPFVRVDQLAFGLSLAALFVVVRWPNGRGGLIAAAALMVAAAYTKQSYALSAPLAAFVWLLTQKQFKRAFWLAGIVAGVGAVIFGLLMLATQCSFFFNIVTATQSKFVWDTVHYTFDDLFKRLPLMMYGCGLFVVIGLWGKIRPRPWALMSAYLVGATIEAITIGKDGSSINYLYELSAAFGLVAGALVAWPGKKFRWASAILMVLVATQIYAMADWYHNDFQTGYNFKFEHQNEVAQLAKIVKDAPAPVLADEYMGLIPLVGQTVYMQPFEFKQLKDAGIWDDQTIAGEISKKKFSAILIYTPSSWDSFSERWTPLLRSTILLNYEVTGFYAETEVYTPRK